MLREISLAEVKRHNSVKSDWIVIHNEIYDVTKYLSEHPGGEEPLLEVAGQVATQSFEDIGHSDDAREIMKKYKIGALPANEHSILNSEAPKVGDTETWCTAWNREYIVYPAKASHHSCGPDEDPDSNTRDKSCRNFDGSPSHKRPSVAKTTSVPRIERRVNAIVVPREQRRPRPRGQPCDEGTHSIPRPRPRPRPQPLPLPTPPPTPRRRSSVPPESSNWWKWALLALAGAITVGLIVKKKMGT